MILEAWLELFKPCVHYFLSNFYFLPNDSPSKTMNTIYMYFLLPLFFSLSAITLQVDSREILKFVMSSIVQIRT